MYRKLICLIGLMAVFAWSASALAGTTLVDEFDSYANGQIDAVTANWKGIAGFAGESTAGAVIEADPANPANKVLRVVQNHWGGAYGILSGNAIIANGTTKTLFLRLRASTITTDASFGLTDIDAPTANVWGQYCPQFRIYNGTIQARDGVAFSLITLPVAANTWYNLWVVVNHTVNTFDVYMNTSGNTATESDRLGTTSYAFRTSNTNALDRFLWLTGLVSTDQIWVDDIYVSDGVNLTAKPGEWASCPNPANGAVGVPRHANLSWTPGDYADKHDIYFGTSFNDVNDANRANHPGLLVFDPSVEPNSYDPGTLAFGTIYYWRIDEVNDPNIWKGDVWRFTTESGVAKNPSPANGAKSVDPNIVLSWSPGPYAVSHNVYFGTDFNDINDALLLTGDVDGSGQVDLADVLVLAEQWLREPPGDSKPSADLNDDGNVNLVDFAIITGNWQAAGDGIFKGHHALDANSYDPCGLVLGETYYWRIDEVNDPNIWKGNVWHFTVEGYPTFWSFSGTCRHTRGPLPPLYDNALGWGRQDIPWDVLEPYAPNDSRYVWRQWELESYGDLVLAYNAKDAHLLPILDYGTSWAGGYRFIDEGHIPDWQNYVERVVDFLRKPPYNVKYFQIWNEPDYSVFWTSDMDTFMTNVHLPASEVIHNLGCKVVFGGYLGNPYYLADLLDRHNAWGSVDVIDMHYKGVDELQYMRDLAAARGYENIPIWETEVGGTWHSTPDLHYISNFYPRMFYWALTHNADIGPDMYKVFYYREESSDTPGADGYHQTLYSGNNLWHIGTSLQTMGDLFDNGIASAYQGVENNRSLAPQQSLYYSSIESFKLGDRVVTAIHLNGYDVVEPNTTDTIVLTYPEFQQAGDVNSIKRVDVAGYETGLTGSYGVSGLTVTVPVANDPCSPVQSWGLDSSVYNFYVVINRE